MKAFALHPIVQNGENVDVSWSDVLSLATEYRDRANSYLCRPETDFMTSDSLDALLGDMTVSCAFLLLADKIQNQKDFRIFHLFTHPRHVQLERYFNIWIAVLLERLGWNTKAC